MQGLARVFGIGTALLLLMQLSLAEEFTARCVEVGDGDTVTLLRDGFERIQVRLEGIDSPEQGDKFHQAGRRYLSSLILDKTVTVRFKEVDKYGRQVARVIIDGVDVSLAMVLSGLARHYHEFSGDAKLAMAENAAREAGLGIWADPALEVKVSAPQTVFHGNSESKVLHAPGCEYYNCSNCTVVLDSLEAAFRAGFRPHTQCISKKP